MREATLGQGRKIRVVEAWPALRPAGKLKHAPPFFMKFRGPKAHPNRQRISGKPRRKSMSVPELDVGVLHGKKRYAHLPGRNAAAMLCRHCGAGRDRAGRALYSA